jgi:molybdenum cofactor cytidylyltransferase
MNQDPNIIENAYTRVGGIILAAGGSKRLGRPKQGLTWQGKPFITHIALQALAASLEPLKIVLGADQDLVRDTLVNIPVKLIENPDWEKGQSTSMKAGLRSLPANCDSVVFLLCDQPQVSAVLIRKLIERRIQKHSPIIAPRVGRQRGNPVLFGHETFSALLKVDGDKGGRGIFDRFDVDYVPWMDRRLLLDVDDEHDIQMMNQAYGDIIGTR